MIEVQDYVRRGMIDVSCVRECYDELLVDYLDTLDVAVVCI
jgi:hypothetical protein